MMLNIDDTLENSDWLKSLKWDLPTDPREFLEAIGGPQNLGEFMTLPAAKAMPENIKQYLRLK